MPPVPGDDPIVAEIYGPDYDAQIQVAKQCASIRASEGFCASTTRGDDAQRFVLRVMQNKAACGGGAEGYVAAMRMGLAGENVTPIHGSGGQIQIRCASRCPGAWRIADLLKLTVRGNDAS